VRSAAAKRYERSSKNVLQVAVGTKFIDRQPTDDHQAIQFFVRKKGPPSRVAKRLPRFVYGRRPDGSIDRSVRVATDVIEVGRILPACAAGDVVRVTGRKGALTLLFRNTAEPGSVFYALTCSHVVNGISHSPPVSRTVTADCLPAQPAFASVIKNATATASRLPYDVALARVDVAALPQPSLQVVSGGTITELLSPTMIAPGVQLDCEFPESNALTGKVASSRMTLDVDYPGQTVTYENLFAFASGGRQGDSGGLVHRDGAAAGIFVAVSEATPGLGFIQPLQEALDFLAKLSPSFRLTIN